MQTFLKVLISIIIPVLLKVVDLVKWWFEKNPDVREKFDAFIKRHAGTFLKFYFEAMSKRKPKERAKVTGDQPTGGNEKTTESAEATVRKAKTAAGAASRKAAGLVSRMRGWLFPPESAADEQKPEEDELRELKLRLAAERKAQEAKEKAQQPSPPAAPPPPEQPEESLSERCRRIVDEERNKRNGPPPTDETK
jgi:hypothetical protein